MPRPFSHCPIPIVEHHRAPPGTDDGRAEALAGELLREQETLVVNDALRPLITERIEAGPTLHLDDLSAIPLISRFYDVTYIEDRARLRAGNGDLVATCAPVNDAFERYCTERLNLGHVTWLHPVPQRDSERVAAASWTHKGTRKQLLAAARSHGKLCIHPHMGNSAVWALARMMANTTGVPIRVIAPPPYLTKCVNDKIWFNRQVGRLLGQEFVVPGAAAWNLSALAHLARHYADRSRLVVIKVPDSAGGAGNFVVEASRLRNHTLGEVRRLLRAMLTPSGWDGTGALLVGTWENNILCAPSVQLWIPPEAEGKPVIEGLFEQIIEGAEGYWAGSRAARFPPELNSHIVSQCWRVGRLFQRLGYVGRCSFDLLLVGSSHANCHLKFVECNGRWGGTSIPMTLMNRLFGDWISQPYASKECEVPGLDQFTFAELLSAFEDDLFDNRTGEGNLVFYSPGGIRARSGIDILVFADSWDEAARIALVEFPKRLQDFVFRAGKMAATLKVDASGV